jgi:phage gpG-like protein
MIGLAVTIASNFQKVEQSADKASFKNLGHAASRIRKDAIDSVVPSDEPSKPGTPPHTRNRVSKKGKQLKGQLQRAIVFSHDKEKQEAVIGPRESIVGESAAAHEFGGDYKGQDFPIRSFMGPALTANLDRFASDWAGSIGE